MQYVIMDLEWNNAYNKAEHCFFNEVIEIGAVMLDETLEKIDEFRMFIKAKISKKLHTRVINLTHIQNEDIAGGKPFKTVMSEFSQWLGDSDTVVLTWGDTDLRVLIENFKFFEGLPYIPFLRKYANLQEYIQKYLNWPGNKQIGLSPAVEELNIDAHGLDQDRALTDSILSARCMKSIFDKEDFSPFVRVCNQEFYDRLLFKPYYISNLKSPLIDRKKLLCYCDECQKELTRTTQWEFKNQAFRAEFYCESCNKKFKYNVRFKKRYDSVSVRQTLLPAEPPQEESVCNTEQ